MPRNIHVCLNVKKPSDCKCYGAVLNAYRGLVGAGQPASCAMSAAKIVYNFHHPEDSKHDAAITVESWISDAMGQVH